MVVKWLSIGCQMVVNWLSIGCQMVVNWLSTGCPLVVKWLSIGCQLVVLWLSFGCCLVVNWLPNGCQMVVNWLSNGCQLVVIWLAIGCQMVVNWLPDDQKRHNYDKKSMLLTHFYRIVGRKMIFGPSSCLWTVKWWAKELRFWKSLHGTKSYDPSRWKLLAKAPNTFAYIFLTREGILKKSPKFTIYLL